MDNSFLLLCFRSVVKEGRGDRGGGATKIPATYFFVPRTKNYYEEEEERFK